MTRDIDLIRRLLFKLEEADTLLDTHELYVEGYTGLQISYNLNILLEAGLIEGQKSSSFDHELPDISRLRLTWSGHDFLDAARSDTVWTKGKKLLAQFGGLPFEAFKTALMQLVREEVSDCLHLV